MKAIETHYKGYRFRSRLEARWAVFFDALKIEWTYEPEGFELPEGGRYLPDFFLPVHELWVEVKAGPPTIAEIYKAEQLVCGSGKPVFISAGMPDVHGRLVWPDRDFEDELPIAFEINNDPVGCVWHRGRATFVATRLGDPGAVVRDCRLIHRSLVLGCTRGRTSPLGSINIDALDAARGARFEFGEAA